MNEVLRVLKDFKSNDSYIILDKPYFTKPTKLYNGAYSIKVIFSTSIGNKHYYASCPLVPYKFEWPRGMEICVSNTNINLHGSGIETYDVTRYATSQQHVPSSEINESLYLEEDLVPSQFFGLNDYLKCKI